MASRAGSLQRRGRSTGETPPRRPPTAQDSLSRGWPVRPPRSRLQRAEVSETLRETESLVHMSPERLSSFRKRRSRAQRAAARRAGLASSLPALPSRDQASTPGRNEQASAVPSLWSGSLQSGAPGGPEAEEFEDESLKALNHLRLRHAERALAAEHRGGDGDPALDDADGRYAPVVMYLAPTAAYGRFEPYTLQVVPSPRYATQPAMDSSYDTNPRLSASANYLSAAMRERAGEASAPPRAGAEDAETLAQQFRGGVAGLADLFSEAEAETHTEAGEGATEPSSPQRMPSTAKSRAPGANAVAAVQASRFLSYDEEDAAAVEAQFTPRHVVASRRGFTVLHATPRRPGDGDDTWPPPPPFIRQAEFISVARWASEMNRFRLLRALPTFRLHLPRKMFGQWRAFTSQVKFRKRRNAVGAMLSWGQPLLAKSMLSARAQLQRLEAQLLLATRFCTAQSFGAFASVQAAHVTAGQAALRRASRDLHHTVRTTARAVLRLLHAVSAELQQRQGEGPAPGDTWWRVEERAKPIAEARSDEARLRDALVEGERMWLRLPVHMRLLDLMAREALRRSVIGSWAAMLSNCRRPFEREAAEEAVPATHYSSREGGAASPGAGSDTGAVESRGSDDTWRRHKWATIRGTTSRAARQAAMVAAPLRRPLRSDDVPSEDEAAGAALSGAEAERGLVVDVRRRPPSSVAAATPKGVARAAGFAPEGPRPLSSPIRVRRQPRDTASSQKGQPMVREPAPAEAGPAGLEDAAMGASATAAGAETPDRAASKRGSASEAEHRDHFLRFGDVAPEFATLQSDEAAAAAEAEEAEAVVGAGLVAGAAPAPAPGSMGPPGTLGERLGIRLMSQLRQVNALYVAVSLGREAGTLRFHPSLQDVLACLVRVGDAVLDGVDAFAMPSQLTGELEQAAEEMEEAVAEDIAGAQSQGGGAGSKLAPLQRLQGALQRQRQRLTAHRQALPRSRLPVSEAVRLSGVYGGVVEDVRTVLRADYEVAARFARSFERYRPAFDFVFQHRQARYEATVPSVHALLADLERVHGWLQQVDRVMLSKSVGTTLVVEGRTFKQAMEQRLDAGCLRPMRQLLAQVLADIAASQLAACANGSSGLQAQPHTLSEFVAFSALVGDQRARHPRRKRTYELLRSAYDRLARVFRHGVADDDEARRHRAAEAFLRYETALQRAETLKERAHARFCAELRRQVARLRGELQGTADDLRRPPFTSSSSVPEDVLARLEALSRTLAERRATAARLTRHADELGCGPVEWPEVEETVELATSALHVWLASHAWTADLRWWRAAPYDALCESGDVAARCRAHEATARRLQPEAPLAAVTAALRTHIHRFCRRRLPLLLRLVAPSMRLRRHWKPLLVRACPSALPPTAEAPWQAFTLGALEHGGLFDARTRPFVIATCDAADAEWNAQSRLRAMRRRWRRVRPRVVLVRARLTTRGAAVVERADAWDSKPGGAAEGEDSGEALVDALLRAAHAAQEPPGDEDDTEWADVAPPTTKATHAEGKDGNDGGDGGGGGGAWDSLASIRRSQRQLEQRMQKEAGPAASASAAAAAGEVEVDEEVEPELPLVGLVANTAELQRWAEHDLVTVHAMQGQAAAEALSPQLASWERGLRAVLDMVALLRVAEEGALKLAPAMSHRAIPVLEPRLAQRWVRGVARPWAQVLEQLLAAPSVVSCALDTGLGRTLRSLRLAVEHADAEVADALRRRRMHFPRLFLLPDSTLLHALSHGDTVETVNCAVRQCFPGTEGVELESSSRRVKALVGTTGERVDLSSHGTAAPLQLQSFGAPLDKWLANLHGRVLASVRELLYAAAQDAAGVFGEVLSPGRRRRHGHRSKGDTEAPPTSSPSSVSGGDTSSAGDSDTGGDVGGVSVASGLAPLPEVALAVGRWLGRWPLQACVACFYLHHTHLIEGALRATEAGDRRALKRVVTIQGHLAHALALCVRYAYARRRSALAHRPGWHRASLTRMLAATEVCALLTARLEEQAKEVAARASGVYAFGWTRCLRFYRSLDASSKTGAQRLSVHCGDASTPYQADYVGDTPRLVITPATDRAMRHVMGAFRFHLAQGVAGQVGTGKSALFQQLAAVLGAPAAIVDCHAGTSVAAIQSVLLAAAAGGLVLCLRDFNTAPSPTLHAASEAIQAWETARAGGHSRTTMAGVPITLGDSCLISATWDAPHLAGPAHSLLVRGAETGRARLPAFVQRVFHLFCAHAPSLRAVSCSLLRLAGAQQPERTALVLDSLRQRLVEVAGDPVGASRAVQATLRTRTTGQQPPPAPPLIPAGALDVGLAAWLRTVRRVTDAMHAARARREAETMDRATGGRRGRFVRQGTFAEAALLGAAGDDARAPGGNSRSVLRRLLTAVTANCLHFSSLPPAAQRRVRRAFVDVVGRSLAASVLPRSSEEGDDEVAAAGADAEAEEEAASSGEDMFPRFVTDPVLRASTAEAVAALRPPVWSPSHDDAARDVLAGLFRRPVAALGDTVVPSRPLVVVGEAGSGKTSVLKVALLACHIACARGLERPAPVIRLVPGACVTALPRRDEAARQRGTLQPVPDPAAGCEGEDVAGHAAWRAARATGPLDPVLVTLHHQARQQAGELARSELRYVRGEVVRSATATPSADALSRAGRAQVARVRSLMRRCLVPAMVILDGEGTDATLEAAMAASTGSLRAVPRAWDPFLDETPGPTGDGGQREGAASSRRRGAGGKWQQEGAEGRKAGGGDLDGEEADRDEEEEEEGVRVSILAGNVRRELLELAQRVAGRVVGVVETSSLRHASPSPLSASVVVHVRPAPEGEGWVSALLDGCKAPLEEGDAPPSGMGAASEGPAGEETPLTRAERAWIRAWVGAASRAERGQDTAEGPGLLPRRWRRECATRLIEAACSLVQRATRRMAPSLGGDEAGLRLRCARRCAATLRALKHALQAAPAASKRLWRRRGDEAGAAGIEVDEEEAQLVLEEAVARRAQGVAADAVLWALVEAASMRCAESAAARQCPASQLRQRCEEALRAAWEHAARSREEATVPESVEGAVRWARRGAQAGGADALPCDFEEPLPLQSGSAGLTGLRFDPGTLRWEGVPWTTARVRDMSAAPPLRRRWEALAVLPPSLARSVDVAAAQALAAGRAPLLAVGTPQGGLSTFARALATRCGEAPADGSAPEAAQVHLSTTASEVQEWFLGGGKGRRARCVAASPWWPSLAEARERARHVWVDRVADALRRRMEAEDGGQSARGEGRSGGARLAHALRPQGWTPLRASLAMRENAELDGDQDLVSNLVARYSDAEPTVATPRSHYSHSHRSVKWRGGAGSGADSVTDGSEVDGESVSAGTVKAHPDTSQLRPHAPIEAAVAAFLLPPGTGIARSATPRSCVIVEDVCAAPGNAAWDAVREVLCCRQVGPDAARARLAPDAPAVPVPVDVAPCVLTCRAPEAEVETPARRRMAAHCVAAAGGLDAGDSDALRAILAVRAVHCVGGVAGGGMPSAEEALAAVLGPIGAVPATVSACLMAGSSVPRRACLAVAAVSAAAARTWAAHASAPPGCGDADPQGLCLGAEVAFHAAQGMEGASGGTQGTEADSVVAAVYEAYHSAAGRLHDAASRGRFAARLFANAKRRAGLDAESLCRAWLEQQLEAQQQARESDEVAEAEAAAAAAAEARDGESPAASRGEGRSRASLTGSESPGSVTGPGPALWGGSGGDTFHSETQGGGVYGGDVLTAGARHAEEAAVAARCVALARTREAVQKVRAPLSLQKHVVEAGGSMSAAEGGLAGAASAERALATMEAGLAFPLRRALRHLLGAVFDGSAQFPGAAAALERLEGGAAEEDESGGELEQLVDSAQAARGLGSGQSAAAQHLPPAPQTPGVASDTPLEATLFTAVSEAVETVARAQRCLAGAHEPVYMQTPACTPYLVARVARVASALAAGSSVLAVGLPGTGRRTAAACAASAVGARLLAWTPGSSPSDVDEGARVLAGWRDTLERALCRAAAGNGGASSRPVVLLVESHYMTGPVGSAVARDVGALMRGEAPPWSSLGDGAWRRLAALHPSPAAFDEKEEEDGEGEEEDGAEEGISGAAAMGLDSDAVLPPPLGERPSPQEDPAAEDAEPAAASRREAVGLLGDPQGVASAMGGGGPGSRGVPRFQWPPPDRAGAAAAWTGRAEAVAAAAAAAMRVVVSATPGDRASELVAGRAPGARVVVFDAWPEAALRMAAGHALSSVPDLAEEEREACEAAIVAAHSCASTLPLRSFRNESSPVPRPLPCAATAVARHAAAMLSLRRGVEARHTRSLTQALNALDACGERVKELQAHLGDEMRPSLARAQGEVASVGGNLEVKLAVVSTLQERILAEEKEAGAQLRQAQQQSRECKEKLEGVLPLLERAMQGLNEIRPLDITEIRTMNAPPAGVRLVLRAVCVLLGKKPKSRGRTLRPGSVAEAEAWWKSAQELLLDRDLIARLQNFDKDNIQEATTAHISRDFLSLPDFTPESARRASRAAEGLCRWVHAVMQYDKALRVVRPTQQAVERATREYESRASALVQKRAKLDSLSDEVREIQERLDLLQRDEERLRSRTDSCQRRLEQAAILSEAVRGEAGRWRQRLASMRRRHSLAPGQCVAAAAVTQYLGALAPASREGLAREIVEAVRRSGLRVTEQGGAAAAAQTGSNPRLMCQALPVSPPLHAWAASGLPADGPSMEAACMAWSAPCPLLLVDPEGAAVAWIRHTARRWAASQPRPAVARHLRRSPVLGRRMGRAAAGGQGPPRTPPRGGDSGDTELSSSGQGTVFVPEHTAAGWVQSPLGAPLCGASWAASAAGFDGTGRRLPRGAQLAAADPHTLRLLARAGAALPSVSGLQSRVRSAAGRARRQQQAGPADSAAEEGADATAAKEEEEEEEGAGERRAHGAADSAHTALILGDHGGSCSQLPPMVMVRADEAVPLFSTQHAVYAVEEEHKWSALAQARLRVRSGDPRSRRSPSRSGSRSRRRTPTKDRSRAQTPPEASVSGAGGVDSGSGPSQSPRTIVAAMRQRGKDQAQEEAARRQAFAEDIASWGTGAVEAADAACIAGDVAEAAEEAVAAAEAEDEERKGGGYEDREHGEEEEGGASGQGPSDASHLAAVRAQLDADERSSGAQSREGRRAAIASHAVLAAAAAAASAEASGNEAAKARAAARRQAGLAPLAEEEDAGAAGRRDDAAALITLALQYGLTLVVTHVPSRLPVGLLALMRAGGTGGGPSGAARVVVGRAGVPVHPSFRLVLISERHPATAHIPWPGAGGGDSGAGVPQLNRPWGTGPLAGYGPLTLSFAAGSGAVKAHALEAVAAAACPEVRARRSTALVKLSRSSGDARELEAELLRTLRAVPAAGTLDEESVGNAVASVHLLGATRRRAAEAQGAFEESSSEMLLYHGAATRAARVIAAARSLQQLDPAYAMSLGGSCQRIRASLAEVLQGASREGASGQDADAEANRPEPSIPDVPPSGAARASFVESIMFDCAVPRVLLRARPQHSALAALVLAALHSESRQEEGKEEGMEEGKELVEEEGDEGGDVGKERLPAPWLCGWTADDDTGQSAPSPELCERGSGGEAQWCDALARVGRLLHVLGIMDAAEQSEEVRAAMDQALRRMSGASAGRGTDGEKEGEETESRPLLRPRQALRLRVLEEEVPALASACQSLLGGTRGSGDAASAWGAVVSHPLRSVAPLCAAGMVGDPALLNKQLSRRVSRRRLRRQLSMASGLSAGTGASSPTAGPRHRPSASHRGSAAGVRQLRRMATEELGEASASHFVGWYDVLGAMPHLQSGPASPPLARPLLRMLLLCALRPDAFADATTCVVNDSLGPRLAAMLPWTAVPRSRDMAGAALRGALRARMAKARRMGREARRLQRVHRRMQQEHEAAGRREEEEEAAAVEAEAEAAAEERGAEADELSRSLTPSTESEGSSSSSGSEGSSDSLGSDASEAEEVEDGEGLGVLTATPAEPGGARGRPSSTPSHRRSGDRRSVRRDMRRAQRRVAQAEAEDVPRLDDALEAHLLSTTDVFAIVSHCADEASTDTPVVLWHEGGVAATGDVGEDVVGSVASVARARSCAVRTVSAASLQDPAAVRRQLYAAARRGLWLVVTDVEVAVAPCANLLLAVAALAVRRDEVATTGLAAHSAGHAVAEGEEAEEKGDAGPSGEYDEVDETAPLHIRSGFRLWLVSHAAARLSPSVLQASLSAWVPAASGVAAVMSQCLRRALASPGLYGLSLASEGEEEGEGGAAAAAHRSGQEQTTTEMAQRVEQALAAEAAATGRQSKLSAMLQMLEQTWGAQGSPGGVGAAESVLGGDSVSHGSDGSFLGAESASAGVPHHVEPGECAWTHRLCLLLSAHFALLRQRASTGLLAPGPAPSPTAGRGKGADGAARWRDVAVEWGPATVSALHTAVALGQGPLFASALGWEDGPAPAITSSSSALLGTALGGVVRAAGKEREASRHPWPTADVLATMAWQGVPWDRHVSAPPLLALHPRILSMALRRAYTLCTGQFHSRPPESSVLALDGARGDAASRQGAAPGRGAPRRMPSLESVAASVSEQPLGASRGATTAAVGRAAERLGVDAGALSSPPSAITVWGHDAPVNEGASPIPVMSIDDASSFASASERGGPPSTDSDTESTSSVFSAAELRESERAERRRRQRHRRRRDTARGAGRVRVSLTSRGRGPRPSLRLGSADSAVSYGGGDVGFGDDAASVASGLQELEEDEDSPQARPGSAVSGGAGSYPSDDGSLSEAMSEGEGGSSDATSLASPTSAGSEDSSGLRRVPLRDFVAVVAEDTLGPAFPSEEDAEEASSLLRTLLGEGEAAGEGGEGLQLMLLAAGDTASSLSPAAGGPGPAEWAPVRRQLVMRVVVNALGCVRAADAAACLAHHPDALVEALTRTSRLMAGCSSISHTWLVERVEVLSPLLRQATASVEDGQQVADRISARLGRSVPAYHRMLAARATRELARSMTAALASPVTAAAWRSSSARRSLAAVRGPQDHRAPGPGSQPGERPRRVPAAARFLYAVGKAAAEGTRARLSTIVAVGAMLTDPGDAGRARRAGPGPAAVARSAAGDARAAQAALRDAGRAVSAQLATSGAGPDHALGRGTMLHPAVTSSSRGQAAVVAAVFAAAAKTLEVLRENERRGAEHGAGRWARWAGARTPVSVKDAETVAARRRRSERTVAAVRFLGQALAEAYGEHRTQSATAAADLGQLQERAGKLATAAGTAPPCGPMEPSPVDKRAGVVSLVDLGPRRAEGKPVMCWDAEGAEGGGAPALGGGGDPEGALDEPIAAAIAWLRGLAAQAMLARSVPEPRRVRSCGIEGALRALVTSSMPPPPVLDPDVVAMIVCGMLDAAQR